MAVGFPTKVNYVDGDVLSAANMNDLSGTVNLLQSAQYAAGKNKIINGDFGVWQRGTSFSSTGVTYCADRFLTNTGSVTSFSAVQSSFTPGTAPVSGYESQYFLDVAGTLSNASTGYLQIEQRIEDVRTYAGQTVTLSFWAKGSTTGTVNTVLAQNFGSGGSTEVLTATSNQSITTSWQRFTQTVSLASISGKTIGSNSMVKVIFVKNMGSSYPTFGSSNYTGTLSIWGVQLEAASSASNFQTATGTKQGELAACLRYYQQTGANPLWSGNVTNAATYYMTSQLPVVMRSAPTCSFTITNNNGFPATDPAASTITSSTIWCTAVANTTGSAGFFAFTYTASAEL